MPQNIDLEPYLRGPIFEPIRNNPSNKISRFNERAKLTGLSLDELAQKIVELIVDMTEEEFESWLETLEILADKDFAMRLQHSLHQAENGH